MKNYAKTLSIGIVLVLALGFYLQKQSPLVKNEVETPQVEILATSSAESLFALPPIGAIGQYGPEDCFDRDNFVDFASLTTQRYVQNGHTVEWTSTPTLPGFNTNTGHLINRTYYFSPTVPPGCYLITAMELEGIDVVDVKEVMIRIKAFPSETCEPCEAPGGGGGGSGGGGCSGPACDPINPTSTGGGDGAA